MPKRPPLLTYHGRQGSIVRATILNTDYTVASLALASGYSKGHISRLFRRVDSPSSACLHRLARFLNMPEAKLARLLKKTVRENFTPPVRKRPPLPPRDRYDPLTHKGD